MSKNEFVKRLALLLLTLVASVAHADDGWWSSAGGLGSFGKSHPSIRMVREDLKITFLDDMQASVMVDFVFRNEGAATKVTMAFPEEYESRVGKSLERFQTFVDGKRTSVRRKITERPDSKEGDSTGKAVWLKEVTFRAKQTRRIRVTYVGFVSGNTSGDRGFHYTLLTGASWKGPIGECAITVDWRKLKNLCPPFTDLTNTWTAPSHRVQRYVLKNWEPDKDLWLITTPGVWSFTVNGARVNPVEGRSYFGKSALVGPLSDPRILASVLPSFFGRAPSGKQADETDWIEWGSSVVTKFGGAFTVAGGVLTTSKGQKHKLARGFKRQKIGSDDEELVYLKDVVKALGGTYRVDPQRETAEIRFGGGR